MDLTDEQLEMFEKLEKEFADSQPITSATRAAIDALERFGK